MHLSEKIMRFVDINPGCTSAQIAEGLSHSRISVQQYMPKLYRSGRIDRKALQGVTNAPVYMYWKCDGKVPQVTASHGKAGATHIDAIIDKFASALAGAVISRMQAHLRVEINRLRPEQFLSLPEAPAETSNKRRKIVIANLLPNQAREVADEFRDVDVECWSSSNGDGEGRLRQMASNADAVFLNLALSAHKHGEMLKGMKANVVPVAQGGISSMKNAIYQWMAGNRQLSAAH